MTKLSNKAIITDITGGYIHIIIPDINEPTGFKSYRAKLEDFTGGVSEHDKLDNLDWESSGHTGTANKFAGFDADGLPVFKDAGGGSWGTITGTLSNQTDLKGALDLKADLVDGKVPSQQLPSYVDDVIEGVLINSTTFQVGGQTVTPEAGIIYSSISGDYAGKSYRWSGSQYVITSSDLTIGETSTTAGRGDHTKTAYDHSQATHAPSNADNTASSIHSATTLDTIDDADEFGRIDSVNSNVLKKTTWSNIKAKINAYLVATALIITEIWTFASTKLKLKGTGTNSTIFATNETGDGSGHTVIFQAKDHTLAGVDDVRTKTYTTQATAGGTTTLTAASNYLQYFTGTLAQTIVMPVTSTLSLGFPFKIRNLSSGALTINSSGGNLIATVAANCECELTCILTSGTGAASWDKELSVITAISIGDFTGAYSGLATESNWTNNLCTAVAGVSPDFRMGTFGYGEKGYVFYSQSGWYRLYTDPYITDATLIAALTTSGNWTKVTETIYTYTASYGDLGQKYYANGYEYECINGVTHQWKRIGALDTVLVQDVTYMDTPQIAVVASGDYFDIPIQHKVDSIVLETQDTTGGNFQLGSSATAEVASLTITAACSSNGNVTINLGGVDFTVALTTAMNTATLVATAIRNAAFAGWTPGGTGTNITFTNSKYKSVSDATYSAGSTGASGSMSTSTQGVDAGNDIVASLAVGSVANVLKDLVYIQLDSMLSTSATKRVYVYIDSATTIKLRIKTSKF